jgi:hypothetical protein
VTRKRRKCKNICLSFINNLQLGNVSITSVQMRRLVTKTNVLSVGKFGNYFCLTLKLFYIIKNSPLIMCGLCTILINKWKCSTEHYVSVVIHHSSVMERGYDTFRNHGTMTSVSTVLYLLLIITIVIISWHSVIWGFITAVHVRYGIISRNCYIQAISVSFLVIYQSIQIAR